MREYNVAWRIQGRLYGWSQAKTSGPLASPITWHYLCPDCGGEWAQAISEDRPCKHYSAPRQCLDCGGGTFSNHFSSVPYSHWPPGILLRDFMILSERELNAPSYAP